MALSPSIPTSFVPKQPVPTGRRPVSSGSNLFLIVSLVIAGTMVFLAAAVFLYAQYLTSVEQAKATQLVAAQNAVSNDTLTQFVRLRDRLSAANTLITQHVELSQFFQLLENVTAQNVHFSGLQITVAQDRSAQLTMSGQARNLNSLAVESNTFAAQKQIKNAIFSAITPDQKTGTVGFSVTATLSPDLVIEQTAPTAATLPTLPSVPPPPPAPVTTPAASTTSIPSSAPSIATSTP